MDQYTLKWRRECPSAFPPLIVVKETHAMMRIMEMEKLTKSQIVLLTLLVSFVTSIATGIVTVSLMEQAPPIIPQTINRVVERTVERVVPEETQTATVVTRERTVTVKESDLIAEAVSRVRGSSVKVHTNGGENTLGDLLARAVIAAPGYAVMPSQGVAIGDSLLMPNGENPVPAKVVAVDGGNQLALLEVAGLPELFPAATMAGGVTLGQTVVGISGKQSLRIASGIVTSVKEDGSGPFEINIASSELMLGSVITNTDGAVLGIFVGSTQSIVPSGVLITLLKSISSTGASSSTQ